MWFSGIGIPISILGLVSQVPLQNQNPPEPTPASMVSTVDFSFKEGPDVFSPKDLVTLARPGTGVANSAGDLLIVPVSKYSLDDKKNHKSIFIAPIESTVQPLEIPLANGGDAFWLDYRTVAHAVDEGEGKDKVKTLYALSIKYETESSTTTLSTLDTSALIGKFPTASVGNFKFNSKSDYLVFSDNVFPDGDINAVKKHDEEWENRGDNAYVYDDTFERQWDTWVGPKRSSLFTVTLAKGPGGKWILGNEFVNPLNGTGHHTPVEPFGGTDDFDVSASHIAYTTKDPKLPPAWHTKQGVYIVDLEGKTKPKELTSGKQGATHGPVFSQKGDKVAWVELDEDGYESDRGKVVIYDLNKDVRFTLTQKWDRSAAELAFSPDDKVLYLTAGDIARIKVFALPVPPTPKSSTTHPDLSDEYSTPHALTSNGAAAAIQPLANGRLLFTSSSFTSPNDVFVIRGLSEDLDSVAVKKTKVEQLTKFTADALSSKSLSLGEDFWFDGAEKKIQGWILKPPGFKEGAKKKYPIVLLIHGGPQGAWEDQWSTRWNPNIFAQQGYFTVAINPTGSTTFGQELTDAIQKDWGGKPFVDMLNGWKYILDKYPEVDPDRAVAAGASWGGYAINWIQGHPEYGFGFKALFCHDGVFDAKYNGYSTDELFFFNHEWGGRPWDKEAQAVLEKYNPANFVSNWSTPQLIVHGSKDYRLPETDGIGAFHALQQLGVPTRLVIFPDENHWVLNHGNSLKWNFEVFRWFDKFVGGDK
ncbi:hypothetical protein PHLCEN_2v13565 [Hermanssonia centrifuga]|uniref:Dipeptidyl-peptidase V n=1 Tax=Hermanssonia centrifuga TaxID=98765 RepID=A0A2R6NDX1_9APHY|nr:hypothetical protein PHLCEN_2v13565 [Hermanssonia centrifuga]